MEGPKPFRAVIVGGGMIALTAAHMFLKAGLDFVILERHSSVLSYQGSVLALWPQTSRILDQLGILEDLKPQLHLCHEGIVYAADDGRVLMRDGTPPIFEAK
jgi:2-polyprenyl-6-methoxyphenol hydroxylase-like FAD-dependent oxidoreductase